MIKPFAKLFDVDLGYEVGINSKWFQFKLFALKTARSMISNTVLFDAIRTNFYRICYQSSRNIEQEKN